jgi:hypothetical protein
MILSGKFSIRKIDGNNLLELAGVPLESDGVLFGPPDAINGQVGARIWAASTGRRFPEFGIGSNDVGGYRLWVMPGQAKLEIRRGDVTRASTNYRGWRTATWTQLRLRISKSSDGKCKVEGKAWPDGSPEPADWMIHAEDPEAPPPGHPSIWGTPFSGQPIRFDDLSFNPKP